MSKLEATNVFSEGLITDLNPITTPNNVLTNALNATLITMNGNEFVLQNDLGNGRVETAKLPTGFVPLGVKEYGGIIYVASYNPITKKGQLGSFPSPERNLTQDEIGNKNISISKSDFGSGDTLTTYYKRVDVMPDDMYLNPGDKFGLFISGTGYDLLSYYSSSNARAITFHPAIIDDYGIINYIDEECKVDGVYSRGLIFGSPGDLSTVDGYRKAFDQLLVYKGKKSGKLVLIVELETLDDFIVSRSVTSNKENYTEIGSDKVEDSDQEPDSIITYKIAFNNSGWAKPDNEFIKFTGIKFESNFSNFTVGTDSESMSYSLEGFNRGDTLKYKITPYTQLGACSALARTGIVNFNLFGTGNILMTEWRYYVENNKLRINYGFDINLLEGESVKEVSFEFLDIYYQNLYKNKYICGSTINGNYNGNYTEVFNLPYDLKYNGIYEAGKENNKYICENFIQKSHKPNELIKNNLYCVRIEIKTQGYYNSEGQTKVFYRFLWTTGYFNEEYIKGEETNFSTLNVPDKFIPTYYVSYNVGNVKPIYLNDPTTIGESNPYHYSSNKDDKEDSRKSFMYQDWRIDSTTLTVNITPDKEFFGDYNTTYNEWIKEPKINNFEITYDNSKQSYLEHGGEVNSGIQEYVDLSLDKNREVSVNNDFDKLEDKNKQYVYKVGDISINNDLSIRIPAVKGRLIRRLGAQMTDPTYSSVVIDELRPCIYPNMSVDELENLVGGNDINPDGSLGNSGKAVLIGGDTDGRYDSYAYWGTVNNNNQLDYNYDIELQHITNEKQDLYLSNSEICKNLTAIAGDSAVFIIQNGVDSRVKDTDHYGYMGVRNQQVYSNDSKWTETFNSALVFSSPPRSVSSGKRSVTTLVYWRTYQDPNELVIANLGSYDGYTGIISVLNTIFEKIHILQKNTTRELWKQEISKMRYHDKFTTTVNIGSTIDNEFFNANKSPYKLYKYKDTDPDMIFNKITVQRIVESKFGGAEVKWSTINSELSNDNSKKEQCSDNNIPFFDTTSDNKEDYSIIKFNYDNLIKGQENNKYILGVSLELGSQMDLQSYADTLISYLNGTITYKPTKIYVPNSTGYTLEEGVDCNGSELNNTQVYYKIGDKYIPGNSDNANGIVLISSNTNARCNLKNVLVPKQVNNYYVPLLNKSAINKSVENLYIRIGTGGQDKTTANTDIPIYRGARFGDQQYAPLISPPM